uniref:Uncharacterized protein n=1 Tax=Vespula pensylvanica TaxID=30213 RepID=A0A834NKA4_VESPE|nr:hypothetical protein H0235_013131 [Vespula pensylvanica]
MVARDPTTMMMVESNEASPKIGRRQRQLSDDADDDDDDDDDDEDEDESKRSQIISLDFREEAETGIRDESISDIPTLRGHTVQKPVHTEANEPEFFELRLLARKAQCPSSSNPPRVFRIPEVGTNSSR